MDHRRGACNRFRTNEVRRCLAQARLVPTAHGPLRRWSYRFAVVWPDRTGIQPWKPPDHLADRANWARPKISSEPLIHRRSRTGRWHPRLPVATGQSMPVRRVASKSMFKPIRSADAARRTSSSTTLRKVRRIRAGRTTATRLVSMRPPLGGSPGETCLGRPTADSPGHGRVPFAAPDYRG